MKPNDQSISILNDLIKINNDRVEGYEKAIKDVAGNPDLVTTFSKYADQSRDYSSELRTAVNDLGGEATESTTVSGKIYRLWMDLRAAVSGSERASALDLSEYGEDAAQKAYKEALQDSSAIPADILAIITTQKAELKQAHDTIKRLRDQQHAVEHR
jgi:uncharacterized protein (TIGR02284 family)